MIDTANLPQRDLQRMSHGYCPDCGHRGFVLGPRALPSINVECGNLNCRSRFNVASGFGSHRLVFAHRIEKEGEGGADWDSLC